jgi:hypothetical protein
MLVVVCRFGGFDHSFGFDFVNLIFDPLWLSILLVREARSLGANNFKGPHIDSIEVDL